MLRIGAYFNIIIAIGHLIGLIWAEQMFEITGIGEEMTELSRLHTLLPFLITLLVAIVFFIFGLYGLSADQRIRPLPFTKPVVFVIAGIYLLRGIGELVIDIKTPQVNLSLEILYSLIALCIGLLFLVGGLKKRPSR